MAGYGSALGTVGEDEWIWDIFFYAGYLTLASALFWQSRYLYSSSIIVVDNNVKVSVKIREGIKAASKGYFLISIENMKLEEQNTTTDICYAQKIAHKRYPLQFSLSIITVSFIITIFSYRLSILKSS